LIRINAYNKKRRFFFTFNNVFKTIEPGNHGIEWIEAL